MQEYVHPRLGEGVTSISGTYTPQKELRLKHNDKDILCVIGIAVIDTACCGWGNFRYATIPGYVVTWKGRQNESGLAVSQVEPIGDQQTRDAVAKMLKETETVYNCNFL